MILSGKGSLHYPINHLSLKQQKKNFECYYEKSYESKCKKRNDIKTTEQKIVLYCIVPITVTHFQKLEIVRLKNLCTKF